MGIKSTVNSNDAINNGSNNDQDTGQQAGKVYLVGAGPGDPDLLTVKAVRVLGAADVVLYDRLVSDEVLSLLRPDAERIFVGKACRKHYVEQQQTNALLVQHAQRGLTVCRLKGGDPFIFGRGGEELEALAEAGCAFEVVPGVTAAAGCSAYAGIPLTHRDHAHSVVFAAGHRREEQELDWTQLARQNQTLVLYMGLRNLDWISERLQSHGVAGDTPAAIIVRGTSRDQQVVVGTLADLPSRAGAVPAGSPALVIVGGVVALRERLNWFDPDPLLAVAVGAGVAGPVDHGHGHAVPGDARDRCVADV